MHRGTVIHEMLHAAGFWHEQSRPDRDAFVSVRWENIEAGKEDNFAKYSSVHVSTLQVVKDISTLDKSDYRMIHSHK